LRKNKETGQETAKGASGHQHGRETVGSEAAPESKKDRTLCEMMQIVIQKEHQKDLERHHDGEKPEEGRSGGSGISPRQETPQKSKKEAEKPEKREGRDGRSPVSGLKKSEGVSQEKKEVLIAFSVCMLAFPTGQQAVPLEAQTVVRRKGLGAEKGVMDSGEK
jgi:hypothetical protein